LHYYTTLNIKGESYRLKEKLKVGLLGRAPVLLSTSGSLGTRIVMMYSFKSDISNHYLKESWSSFA
jgi:hypothetical protein